MKTLSCMSLMLTLVASSTALAAEAGHPMEATAGRCVSSKVDISADLKLWTGDALAVDAGSTPRAARIAPMDKRLTVRLHPHPEVILAGPANEVSARPTDHSGLLRFKTGAAGVYRISSRGSVWVDVARDGERITSDDFEMLPGCGLMSKTVIFSLPANAELYLELVAARDPSVDVLIHRVGD